MLFNSLQFLIFFPAVTTLYFILPHRFRWFLLLIASCIFYMAFIPAYILILLVTIVVDYIAGILIEKSQGKKRKLYLLISIVANIGFLAFFKYYNFASTNLTELAQFLHWNYSVPVLSIILPIGLSFHTFQAMSYTIEVYRGKQVAERHFGIYALYVLFYPQLVAGPIERPQNLLHQFREEHSFDYRRVTDGLKLMLWGLFKKVVIADRAAVFVDTVFNSPGDFQGVSFIIAAALFSFQIYCDFSGYSDIAIGAAQVMGFKLMDNFNRPYFSKSIAEFWKRWHISLSTWFKDYLYIPLGGNRVGKPRWYFNLFFVFLLSGLWHGANWTFLIWGALHGLFMVISAITAPARAHLVNFLTLERWPLFYKALRILFTFSLVSFAWIFFRAPTISSAWYIVSHLFSGLGDTFRHLGDAGYRAHTIFLDQSVLRVLITIGAILFMEGIHFLQRHGSIRHMFAAKPLVFRWAVYCLLLWSLFFFGKFGEKQFIYFVF